MRFGSPILPIAFFITISLNAQSPGTSPIVDHTSHGASLPIAVDGSKNPELIPDFMAYGHFIMATAEHQNATTEAVNRRNALIDNIGFSREDFNSFISALVNIREQLDAIDQARSNLSGNSIDSQSAFDALKNQQIQILDNARVRVANSLTADGALRLNSYIQEHVKRQIVIYGAVPK